MKEKISRVKLFVKDTVKAHEVEKMVYKELIKNNFEIVNDNYDLVISIGGDGTFLKMLRENEYNKNIYYASVNAGALGYLSSISKEDISNFINNIKNNQFKIRELNILNTRIFTDNDCMDYKSLNEVTIRKSDFSSLRCHLLINDKLINKFIGDGLIISTPIGSTGYNLALNGSIIDNDLKAISIAPIAPICNKVYHSINNSLIIDYKRKITVIPSDKNNLGIILDGKIENINNIKKIECNLLNQSIKCIVPINYDYIEILNDKILSR